MKPIRVLACLIPVVLALPVQAENKVGPRMYKCVDGSGKVYYSDKMNPDCADGSEMSRHGVITKKREPAKPGQAVKLEPKKASKEEERRDRALMATYTSEEEIDAARDRSLAIPAQGTKATALKLEKANRQLDEFKKQADMLAAQKKPLPAHLLEDVSARQKEITGLEADLGQRKVQADAIRARYEADKQRFRELKGASQANR
jgi:hypothetical protein